MLGVSSKSLEALNSLQITNPTPIQFESIPYVSAGLDVIGIAQTGTGKTLAFGIPMIDRLLSKQPGRAKEFGQGLILAPTRELALQIAESLYRVGRDQGLRLATLIGGAPMNKQVASLRARPDIIVATPGRLEDHLHQRTFNLKSIVMVVLDEADRMLDMGFGPSIQRIMAVIPEERQTLLFSATLPPEIEDLTHKLLRNPQRVEIHPESTTADLVSQELVVLPHEQKHSFLRTLLEEHEGTGLIFARTRHGARKLAVAVREMGHDAAEIHADRTLAQRRTALEGFKSGYFRFLIATDIAARGIDVKTIGIVVNYDLPDQPEDYVHRIGRTGRAGHMGRSVTLATPQQFRELRAIERLIGKSIPLSDASPMNPNWPAFVPKVAGEKDRFPRGRRGESGEVKTAAFEPKAFVKPHHRRPKPEPVLRKPVKPEFQPSEGPGDDTSRRTDERPSFDRPNNDRPNNDRPNNDRPNNDRPREDRPREDRPRDDRFVGNRNSGDRPNYDRPSYDRNNDRNNNDRPGYNRPGNDRPNFDRYRNDRFQGDRSNDSRPNGDRPFNDRGRNDRPWSNRPGNDRPSNDRPGADRPGFDRSRSDRPGYGNRPGYGDRPGYGRPNNDRANNDRLGYGDRPSYGNRPSYGDRPNNDRPGYDRPRYGQSNNDRPGFDRPSNDRPNYDRRNNDRPGGDRPYGERRFGGRPNDAQAPTDRPAGYKPRTDRRPDERFGGDRPAPRRDGWQNDRPAGRPWDRDDRGPRKPGNAGFGRDDSPRRPPEVGDRPAGREGAPAKKTFGAAKQGQFTPKKYRTLGAKPGKAQGPKSAGPKPYANKPAPKPRKRG